MYELTKELPLTHPAASVWALISDPVNLTGCVPGITEIMSIKPNKYRIMMQVKTGLLDTKASGVAQVLVSDPEKLEMMMIGEGERSMKGVEVKVHQNIGVEHQSACNLKISIKISGIPSVNEHLIMSLSGHYFDQFVRNIQNKLEGKDIDLSLHAGAMIGKVLKNKLKGWFS